MTTLERDSMQYDVVIVGAGPAGLSAAIRLKQLAAAAGREVSVCVVEKGSEVGANILSGAVIDPVALSELLPDWQQNGAPISRSVTRDRVMFFTENKAYQLPTTPCFQNHGNYIISLGLLCRWLAEQAEALGVEIYPGFAASEILYHADGSVKGIATGNMGIGKDGEPTDAFQPGMELHAQQTLLAEGCRGSLSKQLIQRFALDNDSQPQTYGLGIKEIWEVEPGKSRPGEVMHSTGWPLDSQTYGGSFVYHLDNNQIAIGNYALVKDPNLKVRYVTSEEFTNEFIEALADTNQSSGQIKEFNRRYREVDVLLIDDIQFLSGKDATLEQFFHTFNTLHQANKRIVIASDVPPKDLQGFNERLISRFESGLTVDVKPPDLETRIAILRMIATMNGSNIPNDVFNLIAERFTENIRELEGALNRVTAMASLSNQPVTKALAEQTLQDFFTTDVEIKPADIITQVAKYFYLTFDDIVGRSRTKKIALARQIAMYLVRELTSMSLNDIGLVFGGKDHTTVMHAYTRINDEMQEKQEIYNYVTELTLQLKQRSNDK